MRFPRPISVVVLLLIVGCGPALVVYPIDLGIANNTALPLTLFVNGSNVGTYPPGAFEMQIPESRLPDPPWHAEARTSSGRVLLTLDVKPGDAWCTVEDSQGRSSCSWPANMTYLSCGRIDLWSHAMLGGPAPPSSFPPGDCEP